MKKTKTHLRRSISIHNLLTACSCIQFSDKIKIVDITKIGLVDCKNCQRTEYFSIIWKLIIWVARTV